jgi:hypothetical protein
VTGLLGLLQPDGGPVNLTSKAGGIFDLDMTGLHGQTRRLVVTDIDAWHWEELALPAGVRLGPFRSVFRSDEPMSCVAWFGPRGLEGKLSAGPFRGLADALIQAPSQRCFGVRLRPDGGFTVGAGDLLAPGQFLAETVLSDRQQKRQAICQRLFATSSSNYGLGMRGDEYRFAVWADPIQVPFTFEGEHRWAGSALLTFPVELEHTSPGKPVTVPRSFVSYRRILDTGPTQPTLDGTSAIDQHLRFQLPTSVLPLKVEKARLFAKVDAPLRRFTVSARTKDGHVTLRSEESPVDPLQIDIVGSNLLTLDEQGGLHLEVEVNDAAPTEEGQAPKWVIQSLELEIVGETLERK